jgi:ribonuclease HI
MYLHIGAGEKAESVKCVAEYIRMGGEMTPYVEKHIEDARYEITQFIQRISAPVQKRKYVRKNLNPELQSERDHTIKVYCEGSCLNIGTPMARAGVGIFAHITAGGDVFTRELSHPIDQSDPQSNQRAEICAIYEGIKLAKELKTEFLECEIELVVSSIYAYRCMTDWGAAWAKKDWKGLIHHLDIIRPAFEMFDVPCKVIKKTDGLPGYLRARALVTQSIQQNGNRECGAT